MAVKRHPINFPILTPVDLKQDLLGLNRNFTLIGKQLDEINSKADSAAAATSAASFLVQQRASFFFSALSGAGMDSSHIIVPVVPGPSGSILNYAPKIININAKGIPTGNAKFDIQTAPDDSTWTTILSGLVTLPAGQSFALNFTSFSVGQIKNGLFLRAVVAAGSDLTATGVQIEMQVQPQ